jgi:hypothetical protein
MVEQELRLSGGFLIARDRQRVEEIDMEVGESIEEAKFRHDAVSLRASLMFQALAEVGIPNQEEMHVKRKTEKLGVISISFVSGQDTTVTWQKNAESDRGRGTQTYTLSISPDGDVKSSSIFVLGQPEIPITNPSAWDMTFRGVPKSPTINHDEWNRRLIATPEVREFKVDGNFLNAFRRDIRDSQSMAHSDPIGAPRLQDRSNNVVSSLPNNVIDLDKARAA